MFFLGNKNLHTCFLVIHIILCVLLTVRNKKKKIGIFNIKAALHLFNVFRTDSQPFLRLCVRFVQAVS